jgi:hypothetical protein
MAVNFDPTRPHAYPGFTGQVMVQLNEPASKPFRLRANSVGLQAKQDINFPALIDGTSDKTAYSLGGKEIEGDLAFPLIHEGASLLPSGSPKSDCSTIDNSFAATLWRWATQRSANGRLALNGNILVVYPDNSRFEYPGCVVNTMALRVQQGNPIEVTAGFVGLDRTFGGDLNGGFQSEAPEYLSPARIITWNDFRLGMYSTFGDRLPDSGGEVIDGDGIRNFNVNINNNVERFYTLNGQLAPQDITAKKREITGDVTVLGRSKYLNTIGEANDQHFTSYENIAFGYAVGANDIYWATVLHGVIFNIEEMTVNADNVFETSVNYTATGDCSYGYEATQIGKSLGSSTLDFSEGEDAYGGPTNVEGYEDDDDLFEGWE